MILTSRWLVVSHDTNELGSWGFNTRIEAIKQCHELIKEGCEFENIECYYGKITESKIKLWEIKQ